MARPEKRLYRVIFYNQGKVYEIFAREVAQGNLFGFIEVAQLVFGEKSAILVDPSEDALKKEFESTRRVFIPLHSVVRIDEVDRESALKPRVVPLGGSAGGDTTESAGPGRVTPIYTPPNPFTGR
ncbi:MAG: DUF1820 family protein [Spirochaetales bacterium]|nr:DUF1820 family protein [Leptospiraceae bacterium]MCP5480953.1 DUF1820 family protein [Spirochaetales bacterium]MCP5485333.1 DUF1820 family protein [Spirochaetales bacterium]